MKRFVSGILAALMLLAVMLPARDAEASVLPGYTSKVDYDNTDPNRYKIDIDLVNQIITVYERSSAGVYDSIVLQSLCTTGNAENPTGSGTFKLGHLKERFGYFVAFGQYAQYWTQVVRGVYIHSVMYDSKSITDMSKSAYNGLGKALSHGCVRVLPHVAQWIFYNCPPGTVCAIVKNREKNEKLRETLKADIVSYSNYRQPVDFRTDPPIVAATVVADNVPVRTGFSSTKDTTVVTLSAGAKLKILQVGPDWCKVETGKGKLGYVQTQFLLMDPNTMTPVHPIYIATETTHLYKSPSTKASTLYEFGKGEAIEVIGTTDKYWLTAKVGDSYGYVRVRYLTKDASGVSAPVETAAPSLTDAQARVKDGIIANFRSGPGSSFPVIAELEAGTPLKLLSAEGNWYKAEANGLTGYVSAVCVAFY
ncbi:MAG TPA: SH3 domain-containing protein [Feifaniaceae bacterium]|nr:SH3 domain-containing protein [Feifaniaceae bacterium]